MGSGLAINIYMDPWFTMIPLIAGHTFVNMDTLDLNLHVADLINVDRIWSQTRLADLFSMDLSSLLHEGFGLIG